MNKLDENQNDMRSMKQFQELSEAAKNNAHWEINQRNKVAQYMGKNKKVGYVPLTTNNALFYTNGVIAKRK